MYYSVHWSQNSANFYSAGEQLLQFLFAASSEPRLRHKSMEAELGVTAHIVFIITHSPYPTSGESSMHQIVYWFFMQIQSSWPFPPIYQICLGMFVVQRLQIKLIINHLTGEGFTHPPPPYFQHKNPVILIFSFKMPLLLELFPRQLGVLMQQLEGLPACQASLLLGAWSL